MRARVLMLVLGVLALGAPVVGLVLLPGAARAAAPDPQRWVWPLPGPPVVQRGFAPPQTRYGPGHRGADLAGRPGEVVRAAGSGRVTYAQPLAGRGVVVVSHGALRTTYEPVRATVHVGQLVAGGDAIGVLVAGHAGCPGTCLHWGLLRGEVYLDPVHLVQRGPSRLLPLDGPVVDVVPRPGPAGAAAVTLPARAAGPTPEPGGLRARPATDPAFALRASDVAWSGFAVLALMGGLALLRRPRQPPPGGPATAGAVGRVASASDVPIPVAALVDLSRERARRRPDVA